MHNEVLQSLCVLLTILVCSCFAMVLTIVCADHFVVVLAVLIYVCVFPDPRARRSPNGQSHAILGPCGGLREISQSQFLRPGRPVCVQAASGMPFINFCKTLGSLGGAILARLGDTFRSRGGV